MPRFFKAVECFRDDEQRAVIRLPKRGTSRSAGYDFFAPDDITVKSNLKDIIKSIGCLLLGKDPDKILPTFIKTGVKVYMNNDEFLGLYNKSSFPKKFGLIIPNSVGIIDADYADNSDNEGEIMFTYLNIFPFDIHFKKNDKIGQGIFHKFLVTDDDCPESDSRNGGFGSTGA